MKFKTLLAIFFAILIAIFSLQNSEITDVNFLFWKLSISRVIILFVTFLTGVLVGMLISIKKSIVKKKENNKL